MTSNNTPPEAHGIAARLRSAADIAARQWDPAPTGFAIVDILGSVAPGPGRPDSTDLWDAVVTHLGEEMTVSWERVPGRTRADVAAMLRDAASASSVARR